MESSLLSREAGVRLLKLARSAIEGRLREKPAGAARSPHPELEKFFGLFVTLRKSKTLRGCIGQIEPGEPLFRLVERIALASAFEDSRFEPLDRREWPQVQVEVSVLSPLERMRHLSEIEVGRHGLYIKKGAVSGIYLPEVAVEAGWNGDEFLRHCAQDKAGLEEEDWKSAEVYLFTSQVFKEESPPSAPAKGSGRD